MTSVPRHTEPGRATRFAGGARATLRAGAAFRARLLRWAGFAPAGFFLVCILLPPLNHDVAAVLDFSRRWLAGERLYVDLLDVNPPLIYLLNLAPAALARWTVLSPVQALLLCLLGYAGLLWAMTDALRAGRHEGTVEAAVLTTTLPLLLVMAGSDFGQRDVMMGMAAIPYALLAARRIEGPPVSWRLALGVTVIAALAFALKPYFLAVPLLVEALVIRRRSFPRWRRDPVPWVMGIVWLAYLLVILIGFPVYWRQVLPFAFEVYGSIHGPGFWGVLGTDVMGAAALLMLAMPFALRRQSGAFGQTLAAAAGGAFLSAWAQHKGWTYHVMPVTILGCGAVVVMAARWADRALPAVRARNGPDARRARCVRGVALCGARRGDALAADRFPRRDTRTPRGLAATECPRRRCPRAQPRPFPAAAGPDLRRSASAPARHEHLAAAGGLSHLPGRRRALSGAAPDGCRRIRLLSPHRRGLRPVPTAGPGGHAPRQYAGLR